MHPVRISIFGWIVLVGSGILGGYIVFQQVQVATWPSVNATVLSFRHDDGEKEETSWYANPQIRFRYEVAGVPYESQRLSPSPFNYRSRASLKADTEDFKPGATIRCWYNPSQPQEAYAINRGVTADGVLVLICGSLVGIVAIRRGLRLFRQQRQDRLSHVADTGDAPPR